MERHHFNHAMTILSNQNLNILERMPSKDYRKCLEYMEEAILDTDLGLFFQKKDKAKELANSGGFDSSNAEHRSLLKVIIMPCSDLSAMTKAFKDTRHTANNVYHEFFLQGDEEKRLGLPYSAEIMDRSKQSEIPRMQVDFYNFIVLPAYQILYSFLGEEVKPWLEAIQRNLHEWKNLKDSGVPYVLE
jgi:hypothetical protein